MSLLSQECWNRSVEHSWADWSNLTNSTSYFAGDNVIILDRIPLGFGIFSHQHSEKIVRTMLCAS